VAEFEPVLLANKDKEHSWTLAAYEASGGYETLRAVLRDFSPQDVVEEVHRSKLRGRGGAGFPTGMKWSFLPKDHPGPIYLCVNADESEPGTFCNRVQLETDPHQILEGILISCYAIRAERAYVYLRYEYHLAYQRLQDAIEEARKQGYLGQNILGRDFSLEVFVHRGAGAYICGEETGLIASIEGRRPYPRIKPPFPTVRGLFDSPTVVNNVETLACVVHILNKGVDWFQSIGTPPAPGHSEDYGSFGPKLFCLSGHVARPGVYEMPLGIPCRELIDRYGGGVWRGRKAKAVIVGGLSTGVLAASELDTPLDFSGPVRAGCLGLGTGGVVVLDETYPMVELLYNGCRFFAHESCGQCTPCREGVPHALETVERIRRGEGRLADLDMLLEIADFIGIGPGTTICGLADGAAYVIKTVVGKFREELEDHIRRTNPQGYRRRLPPGAIILPQAAPAGLLAKAVDGKTFVRGGSLAKQAAAGNN
jgi:NADH-quinone oxidoreductase subunit F